MCTYAWQLKRKEGGSGGGERNIVMRGRIKEEVTFGGCRGYGTVAKEW